MASLERVTAELAAQPDWWWGHAADLGWVVLDRQDVRNAEESRRLIRCRDWTTVVVARTEFGSERFVGFKRYLAALPADQAERAGDELLALRREFASRADGLRVTAADLERHRREEQLDRRRQQEEQARRSQNAQRRALRAGGWLNCDDPGRMLDSLGEGVSVRKRRLFGVACLRRVWDLLNYRDCRRALLLAEQLADGEADPEEAGRIRAEIDGKWLAARRRGNSGWRGRIRYQFLGAVHRLLQEGGEDAPEGPAAELTLPWQAAAWARCWDHDRNITHYHQELKAQADLLRDLLGDPYQAVIVDPGWLAWNDHTVVRLAQAIYRERQFEGLPVLADALQEAGCDNAAILGHCRGVGAHARGCWVLELLLGKATREGGFFAAEPRRTADPSGLAGVALELYYGPDRVGTVSDTDYSDLNWYGMLRLAERMPDRVREFITFCRDWHARRDAGWTAEADEFNAWRDVYDSGEWQTVGPNGAARRISAPVFWPNDYICWREANDSERDAVADRQRY
jgi:hypothetical protein